MRNYLYKFVAFIIAFLVFFSSTFYFFSIQSFAVEIGIPMNEAFIEEWIFPLFSFNNEYSFSQIGLHLHDAIEEELGQDNITYTTDFNNAYAESFGLNDLVDPLDLSKKDEFFTAFFANDVNYKKFVLENKISDIKDYLSSEDAENLKNYLLSPDVVQDLGYESVDAAWANTIINTINLGGQHIVLAFDNLGRWLGSSYDNIITKIDSFTEDQKESLTQDLKDKYNFDVEKNVVYTNHLGYFNYNGKNSYRISIPDKLYFYGQNGILYCVAPSSICTISGSYYNYLGGTLRINISYDNGTVESYSRSFYLHAYNSQLFTINGIRYVYGQVLAYNPTDGQTNTVESFYLSYTLNDIKDYLTQYVGAEVIDTTIPPYTIDLEDTDGVPYEVPDIDGLAGPITDVYPALELLDDVIITIPSEIADIKDLIGTLPADIADAIAQAIEDAIADAITIPDILIDEATNPGNPDNPEDPNPDDPFPEVPPSLPSWIWPTMFPDLFDIKGLDIFKPIFDIVGTQYSMYDTWILIPTILIFVLIIYIIVSLL